MKIPVKDRDTIPWMSKREIPAIKAVLSAWRQLRRDEPNHAHAAKEWAKLTSDPDGSAYWCLDTIARNLDELAAIEERMYKEGANK